MGMIEVYNWLEKVRASGNNRYYSTADIHRGLKRDGISLSAPSVWSNVVRLENCGYLDVKMTGKYRDWRRLFRLKKEHIKQDKKTGASRRA